MKSKVFFPVTHSFEGVDHASIELDFSKLTGAVIERIEGEMMTSGLFMVTPSASQAFLRRAAAVAAGKPYEYFRDMHPANYLATTQRVQGFLTGAASQEISNEDSSEG